MDPIKALGDWANELPAAELSELIRSLKSYQSDSMVLKIDGTDYAVKTLRVYLELERIKKNKLLSKTINKTVPVLGKVTDVKLYKNTALFCLSECQIDKKDIGHTWVRYSPAFREIRLNSEVSCYASVKRYANGQKVGSDWDNISFVKIKGGDNSPLYKLPNGISYTPMGRGRSYSFRYFRFNDWEGNRLTFHTLERRLVLNSSETIDVDRRTRLLIDKLLFFEWLVKLDDGEFWSFVTAD